jgi:hypothetical protein
MTPFSAFLYENGDHVSGYFSYTPGKARKVQHTRMLEPLCGVAARVWPIVPQATERQGIEELD